MKTAKVADEADPADKARMIGSPSSLSSMLLPVLLAFGLFIGAIIAGNFWLSAVLGSIGAIALAYAVSIVRESRRRMIDEKKRKP